jgi:uncharacterized protein
LRILTTVSPALIVVCGYAQPHREQLPRNKAQKILATAKLEAALGARYIEEYQELSFPGGDVPADTGVCTDLVVRSFRGAGMDLQRLVHEDLRKNRSAYPTIWDRTAPDKNIDHRRCPNLATWLKRNASTATKLLDKKALDNDWLPGDVVFFVRSGSTHPWHTAIVSDKRAADGMPMLIDSFPPRTSETHRLDEYGPIHSHFRIKDSPTN